MEKEVVAAIITGSGTVLAAIISKGYAKHFFGGIALVLGLVTIVFVFASASEAQRTPPILTDQRGPSPDPVEPAPPVPQATDDPRRVFPPTPPPPPPIPDPPVLPAAPAEVVMYVPVVDRTNTQISYRFFYEDRLDEGAYVSNPSIGGHMQRATVSLRCRQGETLCLGGEISPAHFGVGFNNELNRPGDRGQRSDWCVACAPGTSRELSFDR